MEGWIIELLFNVESLWIVNQQISERSRATKGAGVCPLSSCHRCKSACKEHSSNRLDLSSDRCTFKTSYLKPNLLDLPQLNDVLVLLTSRKRTFLWPYSVFIIESYLVVHFFRSLPSFLCDVFIRLPIMSTTSACTYSQYVTEHGYTTLEVLVSSLIITIPPFLPNPFCKIRTILYSRV